MKIMSIFMKISEDSSEKKSLFQFIKNDFTQNSEGKGLHQQFLEKMFSESMPGIKFFKLKNVSDTE